MQTVIENLEELQEFAQNFARQIKGGQTIGLIGDLGAGKTTFVQEVAKELGVKKALKSPTFIVMQVEPTSGEAKKRGVTQICHVDAYRLEDYAGLRKIGFEEYVHDPKTVTLVEWADRVPELRNLPNYSEITIEIGASTRRVITVQ